MKDESLKTIDILLERGGTLNPTNYKMYQNQTVDYLCYTNLFYTQCSIQRPLFVEHLEDEITINITSGVETCFQNLKSELEAKGYTVNLGPMQIKTQLLTGRANIEVDRKIDLTKNEETKSLNKINTVVSSPIYNLAIMAQEIAKQEAKFCYAAYNGIMIFYPSFDIEKKSIGSGENASKIYIIGDRGSGKKLNIAIRSCALPAGL